MRYFWILALMFLSFAASAQTYSGRAYVIDGDTLALGQTRVRLTGIDAPESAQMCGQTRCGQEAKEYLKQVIGNETVYCEPDKGRDLSYGRVIARCSTESVDDLSQAMVQAGHAEAYTRYSNAYVTEQQVAQRNQEGVWASNSGYRSAESYRHGFSVKNPATGIAAGSVMAVIKNFIRPFGQLVQDNEQPGDFAAATYLPMNYHDKPKASVNGSTKGPAYSVLNQGKVGESGLTRADLCQLAKTMGKSCHY